MRNLASGDPLIDQRQNKMKPAKPAKSKPAPGIRLTARELVQLLLAIALVIAACQGHAIPGMK
jgi:hypothetical protein